MPQVSDVFGPIAQQVTLDGSGNGTISFQANGSHIRITNIFFRVSTITNQALLTIYKGYISSGTQVFNSNSGSTGANANGNVDLFDGETVYLVWSGGDAGATATATFTGKRIPLSEFEPPDLTATEPIAAGDGSLIFPALKSPNYVAGTTGWYLSRDGNADLNSVSVRGDFTATGDNNSFILMSSQPTPKILFQPPDYVPGPPVHGELAEGAIYVYNNPDVREIMSIEGPHFNTGSGAASGLYPQIILASPRYDGSAVSEIYLNVSDSSGNIKVTIEGTLVCVTPCIKLIQQSSQNIPNNTTTALQFGVGSTDYAHGGAVSWHDETTNNTRITPTIAGVYTFNGSVALNNSPGGNYTQLLVGVYKNGTRIDGPTTTRPDPTIAGMSSQVHVSTVMNGTTDYVELEIIQQNTGPSTVTTNGVATLRSTFEARLLSMTI